MLMNGRLRVSVTSGRLRVSVNEWQVEGEC